MHDFFYGWYMKCQSETQTFAVIPAVHQTGKKRTCSIQIITDREAWTAEFPGDVFRQTRKNIFIGENQFGKYGIQLAVHTPELIVKGTLDFGSLSLLQYNIMGPFAFVPFMECRHSVFSMKHPVFGMVNINGQKYSFSNGWGYWEGDRGRSFPKEYAWTQCCFSDGSLMLSVADIPMGMIRFTGVIGAVLWRGKEYRLATYLGAKVIQIENKTLRIIQGDLELEARLLAEAGRPLKAPVNGTMVRTIHESAECRVFYQLQKGGHTLFAFETERASFEYEYPAYFPV